MFWEAWLALPVNKANGPTKENKDFDMWFDKYQSDAKRLEFSWIAGNIF